MNMKKGNAKTQSPLKERCPRAKENLNINSFYKRQLLFLLLLKARSLVVSDLRCETKGSRFESGH